MFDYLQGRWKQEDVRKWIKFRTVVRDVEFNQDKDTFSVIVKDLVEDKVQEPEEFDYVIVATGHFSVPHVPDFPGIERFPGRVLHAHDFRDKNEFSGKTLLLIGSSYSAEDIALQCIKYGASKVIITWRSNHWASTGQNRWRRSRLSRGLRGGWLTSKTALRPILMWC